ncbi:MAG: tyrosine-type recombinase/integrase [Streptosporangiales bacterium]|nr:tyrosine-type recombinase/integrase [Streptosporangiales bacterium]
MANKTGRRNFGHVRRLPSGRFQASYLGPDGRRYTARTPEGKSLTFDTKGDAEAWLSLRQSEILRDAWRPPAEPKPTPLTFRQYADAWLAHRRLAERTREEYEGLLTRHVYPRFGGLPIVSIKSADVRTWHAELAKKTGPTAQVHAYGILRTIMGTAVADEVINANPCRVRGAGNVKRAKNIRPASLPELEMLVSAMPERYRLMVLLAAWCALRFGELAELRRGDVDLKNKVLYVRRGVVTTRGNGRVVKDPKSEAGKRPVNIPPHLMPMVRDHLREHVATGRDALLFPSASDPTTHMASSTLHKVYGPARKKAGRPDLRFHDLRHTGAVLAASTGATLAELMARLGHSTPGAALLYQHASKDRDRVIADALSQLVSGNVTSIEKARTKQRTRRKKGSGQASA